VVLPVVEPVVPPVLVPPPPPPPPPPVVESPLTIRVVSFRSILPTHPEAFVQVYLWEKGREGEGRGGEGRGGERWKRKDSG
jgi:hypothetical protein